MHSWDIEMSDPWSFGWSQLFALTNALAVSAGLGLAWWGLHKWRIEQVGKRQCELAEDALALIFEAQDVFDSVRSPFGFAGEGASRERSEYESDQMRKTLDHQFVPIERLNSHADYFRRVQSVRPRLKAIFGSNATASLDEIFKIRNEIANASRMLSHYAEDAIDASHDERNEIRESRNRHEQTKWKGTQQPDLIDQRLVEAKNTLEARLEPLLRSRYRE
jgi:hypothetical protein